MGKPSTKTLWCGDAVVIGAAWLWIASCGLPCLASEETVSQGVVAAAFIGRHCGDCHGAESPEADLALIFPDDDATLRRDRRTWEAAVRRTIAGEMPPADHPRPSIEEIEAFAATVRGRLAEADRRAPPDPGRVTVRRLNRHEYRNTVRDLLGVDFDPTDDFPSDEIAHGFDTVGDALSLPPLLLERYLDAAEAVMQRAIPVPPLAKRKRTCHEGNLLPSPPRGREALIVDGYRRLSAAGSEAFETGPIHTTFAAEAWQPDGDYECALQAYAALEAPVPVELAFLVVDANLAAADPPEALAHLVGEFPEPARVLHTARISKTSRETADAIRFPISPEDCGRKIVVALAKPPAGGPPPTAFIASLVLEGPSDPRPVSQKRLLATSAGPPEERSREVLSRFLRRAFRRPVEPSELDRHVALVTAEMAAGRSWEAAMHWAMQAALVSPKFLFRLEPDESPEASGVQPLDPFALASRLSYFLWSSTPDDTLLEMAESGRLADDLAGEVRRMLADPRSAALVDGFAMQWLQLRRLDFISPDGGRFPSFNNDLRAAMFRETRLFVEAIIREDRSVLELLDTDFTFVNGPLAKHYGLEQAYAASAPTVPTGDQAFAKLVADGADFRRIPLADRTRGGLLSQASILTATSNPSRTSPVKRGRWVLEQILGEPPPPPPPGVPELPEEEGAAKTASLRERMEVHRRSAACSSCHVRMDAIGFALENYDAIGGYRTADGPIAIDASGEFPGGKQFSGPEGLKDVLLETRRNFLRCLTENMLVYAIGRGVEPGDALLIDGIVDRLEADGFRFSALVTGIVESDAFRLRRGGGAERAGDK
jgi:mono/diheme cytochrome c family protein